MRGPLAGCLMTLFACGGEQEPFGGPGTNGSPKPSADPREVLIGSYIGTLNWNHSWSNGDFTSNSQAGFLFFVENFGAQSVALKGHVCGPLTAKIVEGQTPFFLDPKRCTDRELDDGCMAAVWIKSGEFRKSVTGIAVSWKESVTISCGNGSTVSADGSASYSGEPR
jgi:hypothetical protein